MKYDPTNSKVKRKILVAAALAAGLLPLLSGCSKPDTSAGGVPPTPEVQVRKVTELPFPDRLEFTGHLAAVHQVEIRPRVSGYRPTPPFPNTTPTAPAKKGKRPPQRQIMGAANRKRALVKIMAIKRRG